MASNKVCIKVSYSELERVVESQDMTKLYKYLEFTPQTLGYFREKPGKEHYPLLAYISRNLPEGSRVLDFGTYLGASALALATNPAVDVTTYDIVHCIDQATRYKSLTFADRPNVVFKISDVLQLPSVPLDTRVIMLDIDPHNGIKEAQAVEMLSRTGYRGLLICDDINLNDGMKSFWNACLMDKKKIDATSVGHWSGTGVVVLDPDFIDFELDTSSLPDSSAPAENP